jgi:hypothetical protein
MATQVCGVRKMVVSAFATMDGAARMVELHVDSADYSTRIQIFLTLDAATDLRDELTSILND